MTHSSLTLEQVNTLDPLLRNESDVAYKRRVRKLQRPVRLTMLRLPSWPTPGYNSRSEKGTREIIDSGSEAELLNLYRRAGAVLSCAWLFGLTCF